MNYTKKFKLAFFDTNREFIITFRDNEKTSYNGSYAADEIFDTEDEAIQFALNDENWKYSNFTIIPVYEKII